MIDVTSLNNKLADTMNRMSEVDAFITSASISVRPKDSILKRLCGLDYGYSIEEIEDETPD